MSSLGALILLVLSCRGSCQKDKDLPLQNIQGTSMPSMRNIRNNWMLLSRIPFSHLFGNGVFTEPLSEARVANETDGTIISEVLNDRMFHHL